MRDARMTTFLNNYAYLGNFKAITVTADKHKIFLDTRESNSLTLILQGIYEVPVEWAIRKIVEEGDRVIDVGANIGYHSILCAELVGNNGKVFSFEPNPHVFRMLNDSIFINGFRNRVKLFRNAAFNENKKLKLVWGAQHMLGHLALEGEETGTKNEFDVDAIKLDDVIPNEFLPIKLMKIDVEGAESFALEGAKKILEKSPNMKMIMEWSTKHMNRNKIDIGKFIDFLKSYDFSVKSLGQLGKLNSIEWEELKKIPTTDILLSRN